MLVLTRRNREAVIIGGQDGLEQLLRVTVLEVKGNRVMLGIEGDRNVPVYRCEIWDRMRSEKKQREQTCCA